MSDAFAYNPTGSDAWNAAYSDLIQMLRAQGRTDPLIFGRQIQQLNLGNQNAYDRASQQLASQGLGGSGMGQSLLAAIQASGREGRSAAYANENEASWQRRLQAQQAFYNNVLQPYMMAMQTRRGKVPGKWRAALQSWSEAMSHYYSTRYGGGSGSGG